jgi:ATP-binding protein involved in chromosome partitioning
VEVPVVGLVENMSGYVCPSCGHHDEIFSRGGGQALAARENVAFLGEVPIHPSIRGGGDSGKPIVLATPDSPVSQAFRGIARSVACALSVRNGPPSADAGKRSGKLTLIR